MTYDLCPLWNLLSDSVCFNPLIRFIWLQDAETPVESPQNKQVAPKFLGWPGGLIRFLGRLSLSPCVSFSLSIYSVLSVLLMAPVAEGESGPAT